MHHQANQPQQFDRRQDRLRGGAPSALLTGHGALTSRPHVSTDLCVLTPGEVSTASRLALPKDASITPMFFELVLSTLGVSAMDQKVITDMDVA